MRTAIFLLRLRKEFVDKNSHTVFGTTSVLTFYIALANKYDAEIFVSFAFYAPAAFNGYSWAVSEMASK